MVTEKQYEEAKLVVKEYIKQLQDELVEAKKLVVKSPLTEKLGSYVSLRTWNVLKIHEGIDPTIHEFAMKDFTEKHLMRFRNFGKQSIKELNKVLNDFGYPRLRKS